MDAVDGRFPGAKLAVTLHLGNWELTALAAGRLGLALAGVYRRQRNPYFDRYLRKTRNPFFGRACTSRALDADPLRKRASRCRCIGCSRRGAISALVCDQIDAGASFRVPFFGHEATFTPAPATLARQIGARIFLARCVRRGRGSRFRR